MTHGTTLANVIVAVETTKERWLEAEVHRIGGEIARMAPDLNAAKAEVYFKHAVAVAKVTAPHKASLLRGAQV